MMSGAPNNRGSSAGRARGNGRKPSTRGAMAPGAYGPPPVQQPAVPFYRQTVDETRKKVMKAANLFRDFDPEVYPRITFRLHGVEEIDVYLHNVPSGQNGWHNYQYAIDNILPLYKRQDEDRKMRSRGLARLGRDVSNEIANLSPQEKEILLMSNKEFSARYSGQVPVVQQAPAAVAAQAPGPAPVVPRPVVPATPVPSQIESEMAARIVQLQAALAAMGTQPLPGPEKAQALSEHVPPSTKRTSSRRRSWSDEVEEEIPLPPPPPKVEAAPPLGGTSAARAAPQIPQGGLFGAQTPKPTTQSSTGGRKIPSPTTNI